MSEPLNPTPQQQSEILMQALPHMLRYDDAIIVVKYGGHAMGDEAKARNFAKDMVLLEQSGINPVVVHGGGPQIGSMLKKLGIESHFSGGLRVTDKPTIEIVEMVLAGSINKQIVGSINAEGGRAVGLCGKDGNMVTARKVTRAASLRRAGRGRGRSRLCRRARQGGHNRARPDPRPRAYPRAGAGRARRGRADLQRQRRHLRRRHRRSARGQAPPVSDRRSRAFSTGTESLIKELRVDDIRRLIADGTITGGMIPKVETCIYALERGVEGVVILDGKVPHAVLIELLTDYGAGTLITR